jgi:hypothetical protein
MMGGSDSGSGSGSTTLPHIEVAFRKECDKLVEV